MIFGLPFGSFEGLMDNRSAGTVLWGYRGYQHRQLSDCLTLELPLALLDNFEAPVRNFFRKPPMTPCDKHHTKLAT